MPTAIVTGATGILGRSILEALVKSPAWTRIHAFSRPQKPLVESDKVKHDLIDLTASREKIAEALESQFVNAEYLFYAAYLLNRDEAEATKINGSCGLIPVPVTGRPETRLLLNTGVLVLF
jgi:uncharacterized protein YbjT (DUF2867 family)